MSNSKTESRYGLDPQLLPSVVNELVLLILCCFHHDCSGLITLLCMAVLFCLFLYPLSPKCTGPGD